MWCEDGEREKLYTLKLGLRFQLNSKLEKIVGRGAWTAEPFHTAALTPPSSTNGLGAEQAGTERAV